MRCLLSLFFFLLFSLLTSHVSANGNQQNLEKGTPYILYRRAPTYGFWSNFLVMLDGINRADREGWIPVIDMEHYPTHYSEKEKFLDTMNSWEYFFEQPGGIPLNVALLRNHKDCEGGLGVFTESHAITAPQYHVQRAQELIEKYIKVKRHILDEVDATIGPGIHDEILGVHVRGTDRRQGIYVGHPRTQNAISYLEHALALDKVHHFSSIFLACDEIETVEMFRKVFGDRLIVKDAYRVSAHLQTSTDYDWLFGATRPLHRYLLGKEILVDTLLLSRAGHLLCGSSNVSTAAQFFAKKKQVIHEVKPP